MKTIGQLVCLNISFSRKGFVLSYACLPRAVWSWYFQNLLSLVGFSEKTEESKGTYGGA